VKKRGRVHVTVSDLGYLLKKKKFATHWVVLWCLGLNILMYKSVLYVLVIVICLTILSAAQISQPLTPKWQVKTEYFFMPLLFSSFLIKHVIRVYKKRSLPNLKYCTGIYMEGMRKTTKDLNYNSWSACLLRKKNGFISPSAEWAHGSGVEGHYFVLQDYPEVHVYLVHHLYPYSQ
jgi:hypothetical protein